MLAGIVTRQNNVGPGEDDMTLRLQQRSFLQRFSAHGWLVLIERRQIFFAPKIGNSCFRLTLWFLYLRNLYHGYENVFLGLILHGVSSVVRHPPKMPPFQSDNSAMLDVKSTSQGILVPRCFEWNEPAL